MTSETKKPSGGQKANENAAKRGAFVALLRRKITQDPKKLDRIADTLFKMAEEGDMAAIKEISDRLDGKAIAAVEMSGPDGDPIQVEQAGTFAKELMAKLLAVKQKEADN